MNHSVTFDPMTDDVNDILLAVAWAYGYADVTDALEAEADVEDETEEAVTKPFGWTTPKMRRYVAALMPTAQKVLRAIAEGAPTISVDDAQEASGLKGFEYGGAMSSFGFAARNVRGVKSKPFVKVGRQYQIDPAIAKIVLEVLDES
jgi:hypothetical protein